MPPAERFVITFAAELPQEPLPYGRWAQTLAEYFVAACREIEPGDEDLGEAGEIAWFPDRTYAGRTYVPATARTSTGFELFGYVSFAVQADGGEPAGFAARADFTTETAEANPDWRLDLSDEVVGTWRGEQGHVAEMTLVWGVPMTPGGVIVTAELAGLTVDQCTLEQDRFTLIAADAYRSDYLEIKLWSRKGEELARESLYVDDDGQE